MKNKNIINKTKIKEESTEFMSVCIELEKSDIYLLSVEVPITKENMNDNKKINYQAITMGWNAINNKLVDLDKASVGSSFSNKILKRIKVDKNGKVIK